MFRAARRGLSAVLAAALSSAAALAQEPMRFDPGFRGGGASLAQTERGIARERAAEQPADLPRGRVQKADGLPNFGALPPAQRERAAAFAREALPAFTTVFNTGGDMAAATTNLVSAAKATFADPAITAGFQAVADGIRNKNFDPAAPAVVELFTRLESLGIVLQPVSGVDHMAGRPTIVLTLQGIVGSQQETLRGKTATVYFVRELVPGRNENGTVAYSHFNTATKSIFVSEDSIDRTARSDWSFLKGNGKTVLPAEFPAGLAQKVDTVIRDRFQKDTGGKMTFEVFRALVKENQVKHEMGHWLFENHMKDPARPQDGAENEFRAMSVELGETSPTYTLLALRRVVQQATLPVDRDHNHGAIMTMQTLQVGHSARARLNGTEELTFWENEPSQENMEGLFKQQPSEIRADMNKYRDYFERRLMEHRLNPEP